MIGKRLSHSESFISEFSPHVKRNLTVIVMGDTSVMRKDLHDLFNILSINVSPERMLLG